MLTDVAHFLSRPITTVGCIFHTLCRKTIEIMSVLRYVAILSAAFSVTLLLGCDASIESSEHQARLELADHRGWVRAKADSRDKPIRDIGNVQVGRLAHGKEITLPLDITGAHRALVIGSCDRQCDDLDLRVVTAKGHLVDADEEDDDYPRVYINKDKPEPLMLRVRMARCRDASCSFAIAQFEYDDYMGSKGTCFAVSPQGHILTSLHVVEDAETLTVTFPDGRRGKASILRRSQDNDLALLRTAIATPDWLPLAARDEITMGMPAFTVGFPSPGMLGSEIKLTEGSVSALSGYKEESALFQVSIPIQPGSSGGPVLSTAGRVIGIIETSVEEDNAGNPMQLMNFARYAHIASLLIPPELTLPRTPLLRSRDQAIARATRAVCQVKGE